MNFHEYQAKQLLAKYGVAVPKGAVAYTPDEAEKVARELGGPVRGDLTQLPGLLVARCLAGEALHARAWLIELWRLLRPALLGRAAVPPRIWST